MTVEAQIRSKVSVHDRVRSQLQNMVRDDRGVDVGPGAKKYFGCSQSTLRRVVHEMNENHLAKIFYVGKKKDGKKVTVKVLGHANWTFLHATKHQILDLTTKPLQNYRETKAILSRSTVSRFDAPKSMLNHRIRQLKRQGKSNVLIASILDISESTVRRRLKTPIEPIELLLDEMLASLEYSRESILNSLLGSRQFTTVFDYQLDEHFLKIHTNRRQVEIDLKNKRVKFNLEFIATIKDEEK